MKIPTRHGTK